MNNTVGIIIKCMHMNNVSQLWVKDWKQRVIIAELRFVATCVKVMIRVKMIMINLRSGLECFLGFRCDCGKVWFTNAALSITVL